MGTHWGLPLLEELLPAQLRERLRSAQSDPFSDPQDAFYVYNGVTGDLVRKLPLPRTVRYSRRKLRDLCAEGVDILVNMYSNSSLSCSTVKQYDHKLEDISFSDYEDGPVTAKFANGQEFIGSVIVGTDGPRSKVRELVLGAEKGCATQMNVILCNETVDYHDAEKARFVRQNHPICCTAMHPNMYSFLASKLYFHFLLGLSGVHAWAMPCSLIPSPSILPTHNATHGLLCLFLPAVHEVGDPDDPLTWRFQFALSFVTPSGSKWEPEWDSSAGRVAELKKRASEFAEPFRSAILWLPDNQDISFDRIVDWVTIPWDSRCGKITLAGDAAHPMAVCEPYFLLFC
jgi:2-polyprenyl-6-methoxyphenol hydroxylase-like FAD-dependent oxidoreductase